MNLYMLSLLELKKSRGVPSADTTDDALMSTLLEGLHARFESFCDRGFERQTVTEIHDGGEEVIFVDLYPVEVVTEVLESGLSLSPSGYSLVAPRGKIYRTDRCWTSGRQNIAITYTGGYASVTDGAEPDAGQYAMPSDLRRAMLLQADYEYRNRNTLGNQSISAQGMSITLAPAKLLPEVMDILHGYRRML